MKLDFVVMGAQKAGTTALHDWLAVQPGLRLPAIKETHFFSHDERYASGLDWYRSQFAGAGSLVGEVDPEYMFVPAAAQRIAERGLAPRLVFVLRHPLERAYSQYQMSRRRGLESLSFGAALDAEAQRLAVGADPSRAEGHWSYLARGDYGQQIERVRGCLPMSECLYLRFEDLTSSASSGVVFERLAEFIGLQDPVMTELSRSNSASEPRLQWLNRVLWQGGGLRRAVGRLIPSKDVKRHIGVWLDKVNQRPLKSRESLSELAVPRWVRQRVEQQVLDTERVTSWNLQAWRRRLELQHWVRG